MLLEGLMLVLDLLKIYIRIGGPGGVVRVKCLKTGTPVASDY